MANVVDSKISNTNRDFTAHYRKRSCCGQLTFTWATGLLYRGFKEELKPNELWDIDNSQKADVMHKKLKEKWNEELKKPKEKRSLQTAVFNTFGFQLFVTKKLEQWKTLNTNIETTFKNIATKRREKNHRQL